MTLLVPTDFSKLSQVAVLYAARLAKKLKAKVIVLSVIDMNTSAASSIKWKKLDDEMIKIARQDAEQIIEDVRRQIKGKLEITYQLVKGYPIKDMIETFAVKNKVDLILMGTKGASGLKKIIMGSNTAAVISNSGIPVITVPGETKYKQIKKIIYASDLTNLLIEIKTLVRFARIFNASIRILHVIPGNSTKEIDIKKVVADMIKQAKYTKISLIVSRNDRVADAVDHFVAAQKADILAMFTHKLGFYEKLFGKSITRQLAFHARIPLLTFNRATLS